MEVALPRTPVSPHLQEKLSGTLQSTTPPHPVVHPSVPKGNTEQGSQSY